MEELLLAIPLSNRNAIERMFCRLKDFRRVATRYDRNAVNLPRRSLHRGRRQLLVMSLDPRPVECQGSVEVIGSPKAPPRAADPTHLLRLSRLRSCGQRVVEGWHGTSLTSAEREPTRE